MGYTDSGRNPNSVLIIRERSRVFVGKKKKVTFKESSLVLTRKT